MKKQLLTFAFIVSALCSTVKAQIYSFELDNQPYQEITTGTSLNQGNTWANLADFFGYILSQQDDIKLPIGFNFTYKGGTSDSISFRGWSIALEGHDSDIVIGNFFSGDTITKSRNLELFPHNQFANFIDRGVIDSNSVSPILIKTTGSAGSRICKIQYKNVGNLFEFDSLGTTNDFTNMQIWLYEGSNNIEFRYGPSSGPWFRGVETGVFYTGIGDFGNILFDENLDISAPVFETLLLSGDSSNPMVENDYYAFDDSSLNVVNQPSSGTIYRFSTYPASIQERANQSNLMLFPNPTSKNQPISLKSTDALNQVQIQSIDGKVLFEQNNIQSKTLEIPSQNWAKGVYIVQQTNAQGQAFSQKLIVE